MNLKKLNPWNWFKHEENAGQKPAQVPVSDRTAGSVPLRYTSEPNSLDSLHQEINRVFDRAFESFAYPALRNDLFRQYSPHVFADNQLRPAWFQPQIDVSCTDTSYQIKLDVPGLQEQDLDIELSGDVLTVRGQKHEKSETTDRRFYRMERRSGMFQRTLAIPDDAAKEDIKASLCDGVLCLEMPRIEKAAEDSKKITING